MKLLKNVFFKTVCYNNQGIKKIKDFLKFSNEEIYFTLQSSNNKYIKSHNLSPDTWEKVFTYWFANFSDGYNRAFPNFMMKYIRRFLLFS